MATRRGTTRGPRRVLLAFLLVAQALVPPIAIAAQSWSITHAPTDIAQGSLSAVTVTVTNTSSDDGGGKSIGCVRVVLPVSFTVDSVTVDSVSRGFIWSAGFSGSGPTTVELRAASDSNRLRGDPQFDVLVFTVNVTGDTSGGFTWTANEYEKPDCSQNHNQPQSLAVTVGAPANVAPVATDDGYTFSKNVPLIVPAPGVLANDSDPDGDPLSATVLSGPSNGTLVLAGNGFFTYTPDLGFDGVDTFTYTLSDGALTDTATVTLTGIDDPPIAVDDSGTVVHDRILAVAAPGVLANDTDANGDALTAALVTAPASGSVALAPDGSYTYTPDPGFVGTDSFTYAAHDGASQSAPATVTIDVTNAAPTGTGDAYSTWRNTRLDVVLPGVLANDADADGDALTAALVSGTAFGTVTLNPDGSVTYIPDPGFVGTDGFSYTVSDGIATSGPVDVTFDIVNRPPSVASHGHAVVHDRSLTKSASLGVLAGASDPDGDPLTAVLVTPPSYGTVTLSANGSFSYTPTPGYVGTDAFVYAASDGLAQSSETVTITVTNTAPAAADDSWGTQAGQALVVGAAGVLANDGDADGDAIVAVLVSGPANGTLALSADGSFTYMPNGGFSGSDSFVYRASDGLATSADAQVALTVVAVPPPPPPPPPTPTPPPPPTPTPPPPPKPTPAPTPEPTPAPTPEPTPTPTPEPTPTPTPEPTPTPTPEPTPRATATPGLGLVDVFAIGGDDDGTGGAASLASVDLASALLAGLDAFAWAVPGLALSVPGLIVVLAIAAQSLGGLAWLPVVRRKIGSFGIRPQRRGSAAGS